MIRRLFCVLAVMCMVMALAVTPVCAEYPSKLSARELLKLSLDYCSSMDQSKYINETWDVFNEALENAWKIYNNSGASEVDMTTARGSLEKEKSRLKFVQSDEPGDPLSFRLLDKNEVVNEMGVGWNLGNTMDGTSNDWSDGYMIPCETGWQPNVTTKEMIKSIHDAGFNTIRIPITWGTMIDDEDGYSINPDWISRVQDIVDYCIDLDMYAIINIHHDGAEQYGWLRVAADDIDSVYEKFEGTWRSIASYFKNYDEHLIFESINELTCMEGDMKNSSQAKAYDIPIIVNLNQIFVNVVRSTGSNNLYRYLSVASHYANGGTEDNFIMPEDTYNIDNRLMFTTHIYKNNTSVSWKYDEAYEVINVLKKICKKFSDYPIILAEYGNRYHEFQGNPSGANDIQRGYYDEIVTKGSKVCGAVPCVWDNRTGGDFSIWDRVNNKPIWKNITDSMMRGHYIEPSELNLNDVNLTDIIENPQINKITDISGLPDSLTLEYGEVKNLNFNTEPAETNDVLLWKSSDDSIVTVHRGIMRARAVGSATITVFSQSGSCEKTFAVTVKPSISDVPANEILTAKEKYEIGENRAEYINAQILPSESDDDLIYVSDDDSIVTVNKFGKMVGVKIGKAQVTVQSASGLKKKIDIEVVDAEPYYQEIEETIKSLKFEDDGKSDTIPLPTVDGYKFEWKTNTNDKYSYVNDGGAITVIRPAYGEASVESSVKVTAYNEITGYSLTSTVKFNISPYINTDGSGSVKCNFYLDNKYKDAETFVIKFYKKGALVKSSSVSVPSNVNIYSESISGIPNGDYIVKFTPTSDVMRVKESSQEVSIIPDNETSLNVLAAQMVYTNIKACESISPTDNITVIDFLEKMTDKERQDFKNSKTIRLNYTVVVSPENISNTAFIDILGGDIPVEYQASSDSSRYTRLRIYKRWNQLDMIDGTLANCSGSKDIEGHQKLNIGGKFQDGTIEYQISLLIDYENQTITQGTKSSVGSSDFIFTGFPADADRSKLNLIAYNNLGTQEVYTIKDVTLSFEQLVYPEVDDFKYSIVSINRNANNVEVSVEGEGEAKLILALYNGSDILLKTDMKEINGTGTYDFMDYINSEEPNISLKAFLWKNTDEIIPISMPLSY